MRLSPLAEAIHEVTVLVGQPVVLLVVVWLVLH
jgi:hypothetical protein